MEHLTSELQPGENCYLIFGKGMVADNAKVTKVHLTTGKVQYDAEAILEDVNYPEEGWYRVRFYNVDSKFVHKMKEE